jgi:hypothetical protein
MIRRIISEKKSSIDVEQIMDEGKILLVNLSQGKMGEDNAALMGAMIITKIQLAAMRRAKKQKGSYQDFWLYVDEFQNFATTSFIKILSEARKYRLGLILANQYLEQIGEEIIAAVRGNAGTLVNFLVGADDAKRMVDEYGGLFTVEDLVSLGVGDVIVKLAIDGLTSRAFFARTLPPGKSLNQNRDKVIKVSRERWARRATEEHRNIEIKKQRDGETEKQKSLRVQNGGKEKTDKGRLKIEVEDRKPQKGERSSSKGEVGGKPQSKRFNKPKLAKKPKDSKVSEQVQSGGGNVQVQSQGDSLKRDEASDQKRVEEPRRDEPVRPGRQLPVDPISELKKKVDEATMRAEGRS